MDQFYILFPGGFEQLESLVSLRRRKELGRWTGLRPCLHAQLRAGGSLLGPRVFDGNLRAVGRAKEGVGGYTEGKGRRARHPSRQVGTQKASRRRNEGLIR